ncbi:hypothetical protein NEAUS03_0947 [Nematocida ausubeli]|nr:hypothetical protein NEAUS03_0947 [Nematocida ausubeli]
MLSRIYERICSKKSFLKKNKNSLKRLRRKERKKQRKYRKIEYMKLRRMNNSFQVSVKDAPCNRVFNRFYNQFIVYWPDALHNQYYDALEKEVLSHVIPTKNGYVDCALLQTPFNMPSPVDYYAFYGSHRLIEEEDVESEHGEKEENSDEWRQSTSMIIDSQEMLVQLRSDYMYSDLSLETISEKKSEMSLMSELMTALSSSEEKGGTLENEPMEESPLTDTLKEIEAGKEKATVCNILSLLS